MEANVRITVLKRLLNEDAVDKYADPPDWERCGKVKDGQEFVSENVNMPTEFCSWAWADMQKYVMALARGANFVGARKGVFVTCCTDGFRPVIFKLERISDAE